MRSLTEHALHHVGDLRYTKPSLGSWVLGSSTTLRYAAVSRTVRLRPASTRRDHAGVPKFPGSKRPRDAFNPKRPQCEAGMRIEPPPSVPWARGKTPAATHAAEPPLEPPGL